MTKAILVIDEMPKSCIECPFYYEYEQAYFCKTLRKIIGAKDECPLKPMPEKKYAIQGMKGYDTTVKECKGYNACIDEIIGEEE